MDRSCRTVRFDLSAFRELTLAESPEDPLVQPLKRSDGFAPAPVRLPLIAMTKRWRKLPASNPQVRVEASPFQDAVEPSGARFR